MNRSRILFVLFSDVSISIDLTGLRGPLRSIDSHHYESRRSVRALVDISFRLHVGLGQSLANSHSTNHVFRSSSDLAPK